VFGIQSIYHVGEILYLWFVKRELGSMWPSWDDIKGLTGMLSFNLNRAKERPLFDRFSFEEKVEYWALLWGTAVMGLTGIFQWFPLFVTSILPGSAIPIARSIHAWEALLAVLSILIWHFYHTVIKESNQSIFTGVMSEEEMQEMHTLEYRRILAAVDYVHKASLQRHHQEGQNIVSTAESHEKLEPGTTD
jgi:cytochrome b subunit of formate dehydrogenase